MTGRRGCRRTLTVAAAVALLVGTAVGCGNDTQEAGPTPTAATATATATVSPTATPTATATATATASPSPADDDALAGAGFGPFSGGKSSGVPQSWIADVRAAAQDDYDRVVFEFTGPAVPTYEIRYAEPPFVATSGREVPVAGDAFLDVWLQGTSRVDLTGSTPVEHYTGPSRVRSDTDVVTEVVQIEDFEANVAWTIGLEQRQPLRVQTFDDPARLVIDIAD